MMRTLCLIAALATILSCEMTSRPGEDEMLRSKVMNVAGGEIIWEWVRDEIANTDFTLDMDLSNPRSGTIETQWFTMVSPQRYHGIRKKVIGSIVEEEGAPGQYTLRITVWVQQNDDIASPLDERTGDWEEHSPDISTAELLIYRVEQRYGE